MLVFLGVAAVQKLIFIRSHRRYLEHVALALNVVSFYIFVMTVVDVGIGIIARSHFADYDLQAQQWLAFTLLPLYWFLAIRRFYEVGAPAAAIGTILVWTGNVVITLCLNIVVLAILIESA